MKMYKILTLLLFIFASAASAQTTSEIKLIYSHSESNYKQKEEIAGANPYEANQLVEFGIRYSKNLSEKLKIESGISMVQYNVTYENRIECITSPCPQIIYNIKNQLVSIPINLNYSFLKYFFISGGTFINYEIKSDDKIDSQNGLGLELSFGAQYRYKNWNFSLSPKFKSHAVVAFNPTDYHKKLQEYGVQFSIAYCF